MTFEPLIHPIIEDGYLISPDGHIRCKDSDDDSVCYTAEYHSSNGYDYAQFIIKEEYRVNHNPIRLFPIDEIVALVYLPIPKELENKPRTIKHINGDTRDISLENMTWVEDVEIWKTCTYPSVKSNTYEISNHGRVRNKITNKFIKVYINRKGYLSVQIMSSDLSHILHHHHKSKPFDIHRLIAHQFIKDRSIVPDCVINHINGNKKDPSIKNIEYISQIQNIKHADVFGLTKHACGENVNTAKLTENQVHKICQLLQESKGSIEYVMSHINFTSSRDLIYKIKTGETWKHISTKYNLYNKTVPHHETKHKEFTISEIEQICRILKMTSGDIEKTIEIASENNLTVTRNFVHNLKNKYIYSDIGDRIFNNIFRNRLLDIDVEQICESLLRNNRNIDKVLDELSDNPRVNRYRVLHILNGEAHQDIYNKYFSAE